MVGATCLIIYKHCGKLMTHVLIPGCTVAHLSTAERHMDDEDCLIGSSQMSDLVLASMDMSVETKMQWLLMTGIGHEQLWIIPLVGTS